MAADAPHPSKANWDQITIGSTTFPGVWTIEGGVSRRLDVKTRKGQDGATIKDEGYENALITLTGRFESELDWEAILKGIKELHPRKKGAARDPLPIIHPSIASLGIEAVYVVSIKFPTIDGGILTQVIEVLEYTPQPKPVPKRKQFVAGPLGVGLGAVSRQLRGTVYGGPSGIEHVYTGYEPPATDVQWAAITDDDPTNDVVTP
jgi:hypothetical protein